MRLIALCCVVKGRKQCYSSLEKRNEMLVSFMCLFIKVIPSAGELKIQKKKNSVSTHWFYSSC